MAGSEVGASIRRHRGVSPNGIQDSASDLTQIGAYASIVGLYFIEIPPGATRPNWHWVLLALSAIALGYSIFYGVRNAFRSAPKRFKTEEAINRHMKKWVGASGRVVVFSRDLSWTHDQSVRDVLLGKASRHELTIFVEKSIAITDQLEAAGAKIICYGGLNHVPRSRFTIVDFEREGARVAVGGKVKGIHEIQEFQSGEHPFFAVAEDLIKFLSAYDHV